MKRQSMTDPFHKRNRNRQNRSLQVNLECIFYIILFIFVIGAACNIYLLRQHKESGHHKLHFVHDMKRMQKHRFMNHHQKKKKHTYNKRNELNHHQHHLEKDVIRQHRLSHSKHKSSNRNNKTNITKQCFSYII